jgi:hypothetical protein
MLEVSVETIEDAEDEDPVINRWPQIGQSINHALEFVAVLTHGEAALYKIVKDNIKVKSTCRAITKELVMEPEPEVLHGVATFPNDLLKIRGDRVGESTEDDGIHFGPSWVVREGIVGLDVVGEGVYHQGQHNVVMPPGIVWGCGV